MTRRSLISLLLTVLCAALVAAPGAEAKRRVPTGFFGVNYGSTSLARASTAVQDEQVGRMAASGVESMRTVFSWAAAQPVRGPIHFTATDRVVKQAARHGISLLPTVMLAPRWASTRPERGDYDVWPDTRKTRPYRTYLVALVHRYGPKGSFWRVCKCPRQPVRSWQIWNEPHFRFFWGPKDFTRSYPRLLRAAYNAVHGADRGAKVVMAGLANSSNSYSWRHLAAFYKNGVRGHYDVLALHAFAGNVKNTVRIVAANRKTLRRVHDGHKPIWLTEIFWTASKGKISRNRYLGLEVTAAAQRRNLVVAYKRFASDRFLGVRRVFWYPWTSLYRPVSINGAEPSLEYNGLNRSIGRAFQPTRLLSAYTSLARTYEGCTKTTNARRCRRR